MLVPTWVQLAGLPLVIFFGWTFAKAASHAVVIFLIATIISLILNPLVRRLEGRNVPRAIAVFFVFTIFCLVATVTAIVAVDVVANQAGKLRDNLPSYTRAAERQIDDAQRFVDRRDIDVNLRDEGLRFLDRLEEKSDELSGDALQFGTEFVSRIAGALFNVVLTVVITVYMLLDAPRIGRYIAGLFPADSRADELFGRLEHGVFNYIRGQTLASLVMGASAALGLWLIGAVGIWPDAQSLALILGLIVAITEFAPTIGPVIGAIPAVIGASLYSTWAGITVLAFFVLLHQIEGHIVLPKLMGSAVGVHPLAVIFGILAGAQIFGLGGVILVLPLLAIARELVVFTAERFGFASWQDHALSISHGHSAATFVDGVDAGPTGTPPAAISPEQGVLFPRAGAKARAMAARWQQRQANRRRPK